NWAPGLASGTVIWGSGALPIVVLGIAVCLEHGGRVGFRFLRRSRVSVRPEWPRRSARARHQAPSAPYGGFPPSNWPLRPHRHARAHSFSKTEASPPTTLMTRVGEYRHGLATLPNDGRVG